MDWKALVSMLRPMNGLMAAAAVWLGHALATHSTALTTPVLAGSAAAFLILSAGMVANDYYDRAIDAKNKPHRPIPSGKVPAARALLIATALAVAGLALAATTTTQALIIATLASVLLFAYAAILAKQKAVGNVIVAVCTALPFLFGEAIAGSVGSPLVAVLALVALFSTWAREVYKDIEDMRADRGHRMTLPLAIGAVPSALIAGVFIVTSVVLTPAPFFAGLVSASYLLVMGIVDAAFIAVALTAPLSKAPSQFHRHASTIKALQLAAIVAFAITAL
jgi:geranylgeranylglycerol-phosphate geranylgeranyltransferase